MSKQNIFQKRYKQRKAEKLRQICKEKRKITRLKFVAKQLEGLPLMSKVKLEVPLRNRFLKQINIRN